MDVAAVLTLVQTVLQLLDSPFSMEFENVWGYKSQLQKLKNTMSTIQTVLVSVERQERLQLPISIPPVTLGRLKEALYDADDLFDEVATVSHLKKLMPGNKLSKEVRLFFSRFNQLHYTFTKSLKIRKIRKILDEIANDHHNFGALYQTPNNDMEVTNINLSRKTHSFLCKEDLIIGRDEDKSLVINMLLHTVEEENVSVVSIVGMGGLGKTALAKLVYHDDTIQKAFSPKMWVCVSDDFDVTSLLGQILVAATSGTVDSGLNKDQLQIKLRQQLDGKKYLLVLDDVWNENSMKWIELRNILIQGGRDSRIIVTSRSKRVANIVGSHWTHEIQGLSDDDSWMLFQEMTLMEPQLIEIGREIVRKCFNVPLAIRFVASLLQGQGESTWRNLKNTNLANLKRDDEDGIIPVLKISYDHLLPHLKSCFGYCAVFPKDYWFNKVDLVYHWMAQGFIIPVDQGQKLEDLGDECFMKLLQRCFFQDVKRDEMTGVIKSCKMHDLVHDLAKRVSGIGIDDSSSNDVFSLHDGKTRHISIVDTFVRKNDVECYITKMKKLRTYLLLEYVSKRESKIAFKMRYLRVLDLSGEHNVFSLPSMMGELLHLRYLDLSNKRWLSKLPDSITQLHNLQTLKLSKCSNLKQLPRELRKLVNLRHLDINGCDSLRHMPRGMNGMICLHKLTRFVLGNIGCLEANDMGNLEDLKHLNNLGDYIQIEMKNGWMYDAEKVKEGGYLINKQLLNKLKICWNDEPSHDDEEDAEALLLGLQPNRNIKILRLYNYPGVRFPSWGLQSSMNLSMIVDIRLYNCSKLEQLPLVSQLHHLKELRLRNLDKLEYMESKRRSGDELVFFPSLTKLKLKNLPMLKGWWKKSASTPGESMTTGDGDQSNNNKERQLQREEDLLLLNFPCVSEMFIRDCGKLKSILGFRKVKRLVLAGLHSLSPSISGDFSVLELLEFNKVERLSTMEMFQSGRLSSLQSLRINGFSNLKSIKGRGMWEHFTALETLVLWNLPELDLEEDEESSNNKETIEEKEDNGNDSAMHMHMHMPWRWLAPTLRELKLSELTKMVTLPKGMQHLTALCSLDITDCDNFEEIPGWIHCLSSLQRLEILDCPKLKSLPEEMSQTCLTHLTLWRCSSELKERCKEPTSADWPKIQHIPHIWTQRNRPHYFLDSLLI